MKVTFEVDSEHIQPIDIFNRREEIQDHAAKCKATWEAMAEEAREEIIAVVKETLTVLKDNAEAWLSQATLDGDDNCWNVDFHIVNTGIQKFIDMKKDTSGEEEETTA